MKKNQPIFNQIERQRKHCSTFGTAAWKTKSVMSNSVLLEACIVITVTLGLVLDRSKVNSIFRPFLLYAVMEGMPGKVQGNQSNCSQPNACRTNISFLEQLLLIALKIVLLIIPAAMSLKRGCDESPSNKKGGWESCGTEVGAGAADGAPAWDIPTLSQSA